MKRSRVPSKRSQSYGNQATRWKPDQREAKAMETKQQDPEFKAKQLMQVKQVMQTKRQDQDRAECRPSDKIQRAREAKAMETKQQDPEFKAKQLMQGKTGNARPSKQKDKDPEFRAREAKAMETKQQDPEFKAKQLMQVKQVMQTK